jgi:hypothetical protein
MIRYRTISAALLFAVLLLPVHAEEGMWTFDNVPVDKIEKAYGFRPDQRWLDHVRLSSVRLAGGCSGAFVSANGLVQTNNHCARSCVQQLSTATKDFSTTGFYARELNDEVKCPEIEVNQLTDIRDVTDRIRISTDGKDGQAFAAAMKAEKAAIARECSGNDETVRCDVVELYKGGIYNLYKYRRYQDVRLVFAPENAIANFGGDPDNFEFPRYALDLAFLRVYRDGAPLDSRAHFLRYAAADAKAGELTFTSGHPWETFRLQTAEHLELWRDRIMPLYFFQESELRGILTAFSMGGAERARIAMDKLLEIENTLKADKGGFAALVDPTIIRNRAAAERTLRAKIDADEALRAQYGAIWDNISATLAHYRGTLDRYRFVEKGDGFRSQLFGFAKTLVRHAAESSKPDQMRLSEYTDANFPEQRQLLLSTAPIYPELEKITLTFSLTKLRETLGPDDPFVKKVLAKKSPEQLAEELVEGTKLARLELRTQLLNGGQTPIDASSDPMIVFARSIGPDVRAVRDDYDNNVDAPLGKWYGRLAQLMFKLYGTSIYPDATATLRLSYGAVAGYQHNGRTIEPMTTIGGVFERATGAEPFKLPDSWTAARASLNLRQPFDFVTTNDTVGGNSGSPVVDKAGEVVGLGFDGNIQSLGGDYGYDAAVNRTIAINVGAIREAMSKVYRADRLVRELAN